MHIIRWSVVGALRCTRWLLSVQCSFSWTFFFSPPMCAILSEKRRYRFRFRWLGRFNYANYGENGFYRLFQLYCMWPNCLVCVSARVFFLHFLSLVDLMLMEFSSEWLVARTLFFSLLIWPNGIYRLLNNFSIFFLPLRSDKFVE